MKKHEEYYCGARWFPRWLRKLLSKHFNQSCKWHDVQYKGGGSKKVRYYIDTTFLLKMINEKPNKTGIATLYYLLVRALGWTRFKS